MTRTRRSLCASTSIIINLKRPRPRKVAYITRSAWEARLFPALPHPTTSSLQAAGDACRRDSRTFRPSGRFNATHKERAEEIITCVLTFS